MVLPVLRACIRSDSTVYPKSERWQEMNLSLSTDLNSRSKSVVPLSREPSALSYVHNRAIIQQKRRKAPKTGAESAQVRLETKKHLIGLAGELGAKEKGNIRRRALDLESELRRCHQYITFLACDQGHKGNILPNFTCGFRLCPNCSRRWPAAMADWAW